MRRVPFTIGTCLVLLLTVAAAATAQETPPRLKAAMTSGQPINLNTATVEQLEALPGVGPRTAKLIVEHRQKHGPFKKIEELMNVKGIGEKSFLRLKPLIMVAPEKEKSDR